MRTKETAQVQNITATSPATASTAAAATVFRGDPMRRSDKLVIDALLKGGTGGTLDVYLQRRLSSVPSNVWIDWIHFPQLSAAATKNYSVGINGEGTTIVDVGSGTDGAPGVSLAANTSVNVVPLDDVRIVFVAGAGTSAGASQSITITPITERH